MGQAVDNLKWTMAFNRARTLEEFVALGKKRGYTASWAYRAYALRLEKIEKFQRDMDRIRKMLNASRQKQCAIDCWQLKKH